MTLYTNNVTPSVSQYRAATPATADADAAGDAVPTGPAAAAVLAAGIGCAALGILIPLAEGIAWVKSTLTFNGPVGPLSGKTIVASVVWLIAWAALHRAWRKRDVRFAPVWIASIVLIAVGLLGSFPPVFQLFGH
jgi:hypothetical protein